MSAVSFGAGDEGEVVYSWVADTVFGHAPLSVCVSQNFILTLDNRVSVNTVVVFVNVVWVQSWVFYGCNWIHKL